MKRSFIIFLFIASGILTGILLTRIFFTPYTIHSNSMLPSFKKGTYCIFLKMGKPKKGDIVLIEHPKKESTYLVKRVAAVENDFIEIKEGQILINNKNFQPQWKIIRKSTNTLPKYFSKRDNLLRQLIKRNNFFLLNDSLDLSYDSREFGQISKNKIKGILVFSK